MAFNSLRNKLNNTQDDAADMDNSDNPDNSNLAQPSQNLPPQAPTNAELAQSSTSSADPSMTGHFTQSQLQPSMFDDTLDKSRQFAVNPQNYAAVGSIGKGPMSAPKFQINEQAIANTFEHPTLTAPNAPMPVAPQAPTLTPQYTDVSPDFLKYLRQGY